MPLQRGYSPGTFEKNVRMLSRENARRKKKRTRKQILAIAYAEARRAAEQAARRPGWLRKRRSKPRRSR